MGVPKRRVSKARKGDRRAHHALTLPKLDECPHCHQQKRMHHACLNCGWYGDRQAVQIKQRTKADTPTT